MGSVDSETKEFYQSILRSNGIGEGIRDIKIRVPEELHGEHFASICEYGTLELDSGTVLEVFSKRPNTNPEHAAMLDDLNAFGKEAGAFNTVIKDMKQFYAERTKSSAKTLDLFPKCYFADESRVVLENLSKKKYFIMNKVEKLDLETAKLVLSNYAQLHAVSYAMRTEIGEDEFLSKYPCLIEALMRPGGIESSVSLMFFKPLFLKLTQVLEAVGDLPGKDFALGILLQTDHKRIYDDLLAVISRDDGSHFMPVVNHGDAWLNNMMFHRNLDTLALDHVILLDFQGIRYGSPAGDISYFLYTSVKPEVRRSNFKDLLEFYFGKLKEYVLDLGVPFEHNIEDFLKDYKRRSLNGFWISMMMMIMHQAVDGYDVETEEGEFADNLDNRISKFTSANPDKARVIASEICAMCREQFQ